MKTGGVKFREAFHVLNKNGWKRVSSKGSHAKFKKDGKTIIVITNSRGTNEVLWNRIVKENNLRTDC